MIEYKELLKEFREWLESKGYKPRGIQEIARTARNYFEYAESHDLNVYRAGILDAEGYREHLRLAVNEKGKPRYNPKTINCLLTHLRLIYRYLLITEKATRNPFNDIDKMKESDNLPKNIVSIEEMGKLLKGIEIKDHDDLKFKALVELLYATGARISEIENLRREDICLGEGYIVIYADKEKQDRRSVLTEYSKKVLKLYLKYEKKKGEELVFEHGKKRTLNKWVNHRLRNLTKKLGLPQITCHGIRHSIGTHLLKKGADIREVQEFLGHRNIASTEVYTRILPEDLKNLVEQTHPREREYQRTRRGKL